VEVEATYENGVLRPDSPLPLAEKQRVRIIVRMTSRVLRLFGLLKWVGDPKAVEQVALDSEFSVLESQ
jgi:predicted DNA-binding antitoxin AbrB/MazE fold protein